MDVLSDSSPETDQIPVLNTTQLEPKQFKNSSRADRFFEVLQSLRQNAIFCDVQLKTDDGTTVVCHKAVLVSASTYFCAMFCGNFEEKHKDEVKICEIDSTALKLLVDYIYTGKIFITNNNVQVLLLGANLLQLDFVVGACTEYIVSQMNLSNCVNINHFADSYNCAELMSSSERYIKKHFLNLAKCDEFLSLSCQQVVKIISYNDIGAPREEQVFECVIKWIKFELESRIEFLPELMEHVRLPLLLSVPDILKKILDEPLFKYSRDCRKYRNEVLGMLKHKSPQYFTIPQTIRFKPRQSGGLPKVILMFNRHHRSHYCLTEWYDPATKLRKRGPAINEDRRSAGITVIKDRFVFVAGGLNNMCSQSVKMLDLSTRPLRWSPMADMLVRRQFFGFDVVDDCLYAVGGKDGSNLLNSAEVFDISTQKWRMICSMSINRCVFGVGVVNNHLYAVGGIDGTNTLKSVEFYNPALDTWTFIEDMSVPRQGVGVGVVNGILYAVGGNDLKSAEAYNPSTGFWSAIADMHLCRFLPAVVALDGLLYVIGGVNNDGNLDTIEIYNPSTNSWAIEQLFSRSDVYCFGGVVVDRPFYLRKN